MSECLNCGKQGPHFMPPSFGDVGFYACHDKDCALRKDGSDPNLGVEYGCTCNLSKPIPRSRPSLEEE